MFDILGSFSFETFSFGFIGLNNIFSILSFKSIGDVSSDLVVATLWRNAGYVIANLMAIGLAQFSFVSFIFFYLTIAHLGFLLYFRFGLVPSG